MLGSKKELEGKRVGVCELEEEIQIDVTRKTVWDLTINHANDWWKAGLSDGSLGVFIEPEVGGRLWERFDASGNGILYGNVVMIDPPNMIHFSSTYSMAGVALGTSTWRFLELDGGTLVAVTIELLSEFPERTMCGRIKHRVGVLLESLKGYVESRAELTVQA